MTRSFLVLTLLGLLEPAHAQTPAASRLPILRPTITELAHFRDSGRGDIPGGATLSPNGRLMVYGTLRADLTIWNMLTRERAVLVTGPVHGLSWGPRGDMLVLQTHPGPFLYQGAELARDPAIWTIRLDSLTGRVLEPPRLVARVAVNHGVFLSPDQQTIAFAQSHGWWQASSLAVVPTSGGTPRVLASGIRVHRVSWSADGSAVFYTAFANASSAHATRFRVPLSGGPAIPLEEERPVFVDTLWPVFDPATGRMRAHMAFPSDVNVGINRGPGDFGGVRFVQPRGLQVVSLADGSTRDLVDTTAEAGVPEWFAGDRLAVIVRRNGRTSLLTQRADGTDARSYAFTNAPRFSGSLTDNAHLRVSPDGRYAAFRGGGLETIQLLDLRSGRQRTLVAVSGDGTSPDGQGVGPLAWSSDSRSVFYVSGVWSWETTVRRVTISGTDITIRSLPRSIYGPPPVTFAPAIDPEFIVFAGARNFQGGGAVTLVPLGDGPPRVVLPELALGGPLSPDGRTLALQADPPAYRSPDGRTLDVQAARPAVGRITLVGLDGASTSSIPLPFFALPGVRWHPDGQRLFVLGRERAGAPVNVYSVPTSGDTPSVVTALGSTREDGALAVSPDGRYLAVTVAGTPRSTLLLLQYGAAEIGSGRNRR